MPAIEERVDNLEKVLADFIANVAKSHAQTEAELLAFKDEMRQINREMNINWGELANKLGTINEDLVAPSIPRIVREEFGLEVKDLIVRRKKKLKNGRVKEFDAVAEAEGYLFVNSTKSTLENRDVDAFIRDIPKFREFYPEYKSDRIVGILSGLYVDKSFIKYAEKRGFIVLAVGDQLMEVKNSKGFKPREW